MLGKHILVDLKYADETTFISETSNLLQYVCNTSDTEAHRITFTVFVLQWPKLIHVGDGPDQPLFPSVNFQHFCIYTFKFNIKYSLKYSFQFRRHKTSGWLTQSPCSNRSPVPVETSVVTPICLQNDQPLGRQCLCFISLSLWHRNMVPEQQSSSHVGCCCEVNWLSGQYNCRPNNATTLWLTAMQWVCCCCHIICLPHIITFYPGFSPPPGPLKTASHYKTHLYKSQWWTSILITYASTYHNCYSNQNSKICFNI